MNFIFSCGPDDDLGALNTELMQLITDYGSIYVSNPNIVKAIMHKFSDDEARVEIVGKLNQYCPSIIFHKINKPFDRCVMRLSLIVDAIRRAVSGSIYVFMPYIPYMSQNHSQINSGSSHNPLVARVVMDLITRTVDRIFTIDLSPAQLEGFSDIPLTNIQSGAELVRYLKGRAGCEPALIVSSPDDSKSARAIATAIDIPMRVIDSNYPEMLLTDDIKDKNCLIIINKLVTKDSFLNLGEQLRSRYARSLSIYASHAILSRPKYLVLEQFNSFYKELIITNTIDNYRIDTINRVSVLSMAREIFSNVLQLI